MTDFIYVPASLRMNILDDVTASNAGFRLAGDDIEAGTSLSAGLVHLQRIFGGSVEGMSTNIIPADNLTDVVVFNRPKNDGGIAGTKARFHFKAKAWKSDKIKNDSIDSNFFNGFSSDIMYGFDGHGGLSNVYDALGLIGDKPVHLRKVSQSETDKTNPSRFVSGVVSKFGNVPYVPNALNRRLDLEGDNRFSESDIRYIVWAVSKIGENYYRGKKYEKPMALTLHLLNERFGVDTAKAFAVAQKESQSDKYNYDGDDRFDSFPGVVSMNALFSNLAALRK